MKILKAFKTELHPNNAQIVLLKKNAGCARWAYNWRLAKKKEAFDKEKRIEKNIIDTYMVVMSSFVKSRKKKIII